VFTYPANLGFDGLNMVSTIGAFILAAGFAVVTWDIVRSKRRQPLSERNPWQAGTLEWLPRMPPDSWGVRSVPEIDSRYPLWDQPDFVRDVDQGRFYLADAAEGKRETLVTTTIDAKPVQCLQLPGPSFVTFWAAMTLGGFFIFGTYHQWWAAMLSALAAVGVICHWLWTGTALIPPQPAKDVGLGLTLPIYVSGSKSVGWWAVFITMLADLTAFVSLVFGYFFYWTIRDDFPPEPNPGPGVFWPALAAGLLVGAWGLTLLARHWNARDCPALFYPGIIVGIGLALGGGAALVAGPWLTGLDPKSGVYPATVWVLVAWTTFHVAIGVIMQLYCLARRAAGRMTARHDIDIRNVALYWHFVALTVVLTVAVIAGFPLVK
jgi:cytochrome c oxidase subunit I+III